jgi:hypothetical protein
MMRNVIMALLLCGLSAEAQHNVLKVGDQMSDLSGNPQSSE